MDYATIEDLKTYLRISDTADDAILALSITAASRAIDRSCNQTFEETVPDSIKLACLLQASRFFIRREAPFGIAGSPEAGSELRLLAKVDPDVEVILGPYRSWWGAV